MGVQKMEQTIQGIIPELNASQVSDVTYTLTIIKENINHKIGAR
jgi:hypothetical protein